MLVDLKQQNTRIKSLVVNTLMQESVAATAARAGNWLIEFGHVFGLQGFILTILYDSVVTMCPMEEREIWAKAHTLFMFLKNGWQAPTSILRYPIDTELNMAWSWKPTEEEESLLKDETIAPTPPQLAHVEQWLDRMIKQYTEYAELSVIAP